MTPEEQRNLQLAKSYEETYNSDVKRFVYECYPPDCVMNDGLVHGHEKFMQVEEGVLRAAPKRKMRIDARYAVGSFSHRSGGTATS